MIIELDRVVIYPRSMTVTSGTAAEAQTDGSRGERTRSAILDASRRLFLERGYAGTPINAITEACGISRAGFYTYFKDKREIFNVLGKTAYHEVPESSPSGRTPMHRSAPTTFAPGLATTSITWITMVRSCWLRRNRRPTTKSSGTPATAW